MLNRSIRYLIAGSALLAASATFAQEPIKIGFLSTFSGTVAVPGHEMYQGFMLAVSERGGKLGGVPVDIIKEDDQFKPEVATQAATKLIERDHVPIIAGIVGSNVMMAVAKPISDKGLFLISANSGPSPLAARIAVSAEKIAAGDIDGGLAFFMDALEGPGAWKRIPATPKQLLRDNAMTLIGQTRDKRPPFSKADAQSIKMPTLFIGGANTKGMLPMVLHALAENVPDARTVMIPNTTHPMFEQAPVAYSEAVLGFLTA